MSKRELAEYTATSPSTCCRPSTAPAHDRALPARPRRAMLFQKHFDDASLVGLEGIDVEESTASAATLAVGVAGLVQLVQLGALEIHAWLARADRLDCPDQMILDLDPGSGVSWARLRDAAREVRERLDRRGLQSFVRTTGGKGLHIVAPLDGQSTRGKRSARSRARSRTRCRRTRRRSHRDRRQARAAGKIYVDYLRNARGATAIANYSTRAKRGAPVAVPIAWEELARITGADHYRLAGIRRRVAQLERAAWPDFTTIKQRLP